ncbi:MAG: hypothetical protein GY788_04155 [bacterium]|nr:hypothetical protein [bacterium]
MFIVEDEAVFVCWMERHRSGEIETVVDLVRWTNLNELKRTQIPRWFTVP